MRTRALVAAVLAVASAGIASPQPIPAGLIKYLGLTDAQAASIVQLNADFASYGQKVWADYQKLNDAAVLELAQDAPDASVAGSDYAQIEALRRDYVAHASEVQSKIAALLTPEQVMAVANLVRAERVQGLIDAAGCLFGNPGLGGSGSTTSSSCSSPGAALIDYLQLTSSQVISWNSILQSTSTDQISIQLHISELSYEIDDLTAATPVDSDKLGAAYVARKKLSRDLENSMAQIPKGLLSLLSDQQLAAVQSLKDAIPLQALAQAAACFNILVQPADIQQYGYYFDPKAPRYQPYCYYNSASDTLVRKESR
jgi:hypothetical protein